jgi:hypothetical protein
MHSMKGYRGNKVIILHPDTRLGTWPASGPGNITSEEKSLVPTNRRLSDAGWLYGEQTNRGMIPPSSALRKTEESRHNSSVFRFKENRWIEPRILRLPLYGEQTNRVMILPSSTLREQTIRAMILPSSTLREQTNLVLIPPSSTLREQTNRVMILPSSTLREQTNRVMIPPSSTLRRTDELSHDSSVLQHIV